VKLIIQLPCYNEAETLPETLAALPRRVEGVDVVEWLVVDDGSQDGTAEVAKKSGADHVVRIPRNRGLASAFSLGLAECVKRGADVIVNTDADNQYDAADLPKLLGPILAHEADMVVGARPMKKWLQRMGSSVVRSLSNTEVADAPSGFRAITRDAAMRLNVFSEYTYTLETIIQAGQNGFNVISVPIRVNDKTRESRLVKNIWSYVKRSALTIFRFFVVYRPMRFFATLGAIAGMAGVIVCLRFVYFYIIGEGSGHVQSLILGALLIGIGALLFVVALLADLISVNRRLLEKVQWRVWQLEEKLKRTMGENER